MGLFKLINSFSEHQITFKEMGDNETSHNETSHNEISDVRLIKFNVLIEEINSKILFKQANSFFVQKRVTSSGNTALALIYNYNSANEYAKIIMDKSYLFLYSNDDVGGNVLEKWFPGYEKSSYEKLNSPKEIIDASQKIVKLFKSNSENQGEAYKFIFWSLMILAVDKTDAENHLALICDFAKMLNLTEEDFEDIIQVVKVAYKEPIDGYKFKSGKVVEIFKSIINN